MAKGGKETGHFDLAAERREIAATAHIGRGVTIRAQSVAIGAGAQIADGVTILCDELDLGPGCRIAADTEIVCPEIRWAEGCSSGAGLRAELNERFTLGRCSSIGARVAIVGQAAECGEFLWLKDDVIVGGGGARGPRSRLTIGDHTSIFDRTYINLSEPVTMGRDSALSYNVMVLTHGAWQPALLGFPTSFAPVTIGDYCVIYLNSVLLPGVTIGDYSTVAAGAVVKSDIPAHCLAAGNPAMVRRGPEGYPKPLTEEASRDLILAILADYATTLAPKGVTVAADRIREEGWFKARHGQEEHWIGLAERPVAEERVISLGFGPSPQPRAGGCHFDLRTLQADGALPPLAEDLRDFLRRRAIRFFTGAPFRTLPLANLARLKATRPKGHP